MGEARKWGGGEEIITQRIKDEGLRKWREGVEGKSTLKYYKEKKKPQKEVCYDGGWGSSLLFKARSGSLETNERTRRWNGVGPYCTLCNAGGGDPVEENIEHILTECTLYNIERNRLENYMENKFGMEEWDEIKGREDRGIGVVLGLTGELNGEGIQYTKKILENIWKKRNENREGGGRG